MTTLDDFPWTEPDDQQRVVVLEREPRPCKRHRWEWTEWAAPDSRVLSMVEWCKACHRLKDAALVRRGKNNRQRGNSIEREVGKALGLRRVGQFGGSTDLGDTADWMVVQVKSGGTYPERIDRLVRSLTANAGQIRAVVHADTPGPGRRRRALITMDLDEFRSWYGK